MKDKIIIFIIGLLLGAVIASGAFYVYSISSTNCNSNETPSSNSSQMNGQMGQPPEKPSGEGSEPPTKPNESTSTSNSN